MSHLQKQPQRKERGRERKEREEREEGEREREEGEREREEGEQSYRRTEHGRSSVKPGLFMSALAASRSRSSLGIFYQKLVKHEKKRIVALVALMRKMIAIAIANLRDLANQLQKRGGARYI